MTLLDICEKHETVHSTVEQSCCLVSQRVLNWAPLSTKRFVARFWGFVNLDEKKNVSLFLFSFIGNVIFPLMLNIGNKTP